MSDTLIKVRATPLPLEWKVAIKRARKDGTPETVIALILAAAKRGKISGDGPDGWHREHVKAAVDLLAGMPRSETRSRRLRGLLRRLTPKPVKVKPVKTFALVGNRAISLRVAPMRNADDLNCDGGRVRARGTHSEMIALRHGVLCEWHSLPGGREVETFLEQQKPKAPTQPELV